LGNIWPGILHRFGSEVRVGVKGGVHPFLVMEADICAIPLSPGSALESSHRTANCGVLSKYSSMQGARVLVQCIREWPAAACEGIRPLVAKSGQAEALTRHWELSAAYSADYLPNFCLPDSSTARVRMFDLRMLRDDRPQRLYRCHRASCTSQRMRRLIPLT
jgi:hypothetical protein